MKRTNSASKGESQAIFEQEKARARSHHLRKQRDRLLKLREDISKQLHQLTAEACEETPNYSMHMADAASDSFDRDLVLGLASFEQEGLYEVDAALKRIEDGSYGFCELTGKPIPRARLEAIPWTRFSLEAENQLEGHMCPRLGEIRTIRPTGKEAFDATANVSKDEEPDFITDCDLFTTASDRQGGTV
jgi:RNA polymerase-binding transcription factor DksA